MRRDQLGKALRELRDQAGISMDQAAAALDCSRTRIGHLETARNAISKPVLEALLRLYGVYDARFEELDQLRREGSRPGWWSTYRLPKWLQSYVGYETDAITIKFFGLELVPGLLQTETYARRLHAMGGLSDEEIGRRVAARVQRQQRLTGPNPVSLSAVVSEGALQRLVADPLMAADQLRHLEASCRLSNVSLRVLPFSAGLHLSLSGSFTLLSFHHGVCLPVAYQEYAVGGHLVDEQDVVRELSGAYDQLEAQALAERESLRFISELTERIERTLGV